MKQIAFEDVKHTLSALTSSTLTSLVLIASFAAWIGSTTADSSWATEGAIAVERVNKRAVEDVKEDMWMFFVLTRSTGFYMYHIPASNFRTKPMKRTQLCNSNRATGNVKQYYLPTTQLHLHNIPLPGTGTGTQTWGGNQQQAKNRKARLPRFPKHF